MAGVRERARIETMAEIRALARAQLAEHGAAGISLRAIARDLGMVSSAVYRYVASRDDLLTLLIIESYEAVGEVAEAADAAVEERTDLLARWLGVCHAVRSWAIENPADYGLIYGTPVPGYAAPVDTVSAATRLTTVLASIVVDAQAAGCRPVIPEGSPAISPSLADDLAVLQGSTGLAVSPELAERGLMAWAQMMGAISLELFGHLHNVIDSKDEYFHHAMTVTGLLLGVGASTEKRSPASRRP